MDSARKMGLAKCLRVVVGTLAIMAVLASVVPEVVDAQEKQKTRVPASKINKKFSIYETDFFGNKKTVPVICLPDCPGDYGCCERDEGACIACYWDARRR